MQIERFEPHPLTLAGLETQRALSLAHTPADLAAVMAGRLRDVSGVTHLFSIDVEAAPPGHFRVMYAADISAAPPTPEAIAREGRWHHPRETVPFATSPVLASLIAETTPVAARGVLPDEDAVVARVAGSALDLLAVPVFYNGVITEWLVLGFAPGVVFEPLLVTQALNAMNLVSRGIAQVAMTQEIKALHTKLDAQMQEMGALQRALLPAEPPTVPGYQIATRYIPSDAAGGDYYDFRTFDDGFVGFVIADVSGHGPAAAVGMAVLRTTLAYDEHADEPAGSVLRNVNAVLYGGLGDSMFVTAQFVVLDPKTGRCVYLCAGHPPPRKRLVSGNVVEVPMEAAPPLGILPEIETDGGNFALQPGETLVLFTDGINEAMNAERTLFGNARLDNAIANGPPDAESISDRIIAAVRAHEAGVPRADDQCVVVIHREP